MMVTRPFNDENPRFIYEASHDTATPDDVSISYSAAFNIDELATVL